MAENTNNKDVIYVDIDDEITTIIDKMNLSKARIVALVLPKRATVFQSVVNMKLLKRRAEAANKHLVLITSEAGLMPLAGAVGIHVAKTPQSKPEIPTGPTTDDLPEDIQEEPLALMAGEFDAAEVAQKPVSELAGAAPASSVTPEETIELDDDTPVGDSSAVDDGAKIASAAETADAAKDTKKAPKQPGNKKLRIPNFEKFRLRLVLLGLLVILLLVGLFVALKVLPKATIDIKTNSSNVNSSVDLVLDTSANAVDASQSTLPAKTEQQQKTYTGQAPATGKKNTGGTSHGSITMSTCVTNPSDLNNVPAGTGVSTNGLTYITQQNATFQFAGNGNNCFKFQADNVNIAAQAPGAQYNVDNSDFSVAGHPDYSANGSSAGGSDNIVKVVQQSDIDNAKQKLSSQDASALKQQLQQSLQNDDLYPLPATFTTNDSNVTSSAKAGDQTDNVTVSEDVTYTMFGVQKADLQKIITYNVDQQIDPSKQSILDDGLSSAKFSINGKPSGSQAKVSMQVTSVAGPHLDANKLKQQVAGKKSGDIQSIIKNNPGVTDVTVHYSPFWVSATPSNPNKITIVFEKPPVTNK